MNAESKSAASAETDRCPVCGKEVKAREKMVMVVDAAEVQQVAHLRCVLETGRMLEKEKGWIFR